MADQCFELAVGKDRRCLLAYTARAELLRGTRHDARARAALKVATRSLEKDPGMRLSVLHYELARCWNQLGDRETARQHARQIEPYLSANLPAVAELKESLGL